MNEDPINLFAIQHNLTPRETDLLRLVTKHGYTNEQIAESLHIQKKTVNITMTKLLSKTGCASSRELLSKIITLLLPDVEGNGGDDETGILEQTHVQDAPEFPEAHD
ncbi:MAG: Bacterial regulatory protein luxR family [Paenibacillus sp.]|nr:Bacterial regulatory protein luxR family [Paenibacillus sp.]